MRVALIGPGRVGTLLAVAGTRAGWRVAAVAGGREASRTSLASRVAGLRTFVDPAEAVVGADLVLLTVPDDAIAPVVDGLVRADALAPGQRVVHVAGSRGLEVLRRARLAGARVAACHPAMTIPAGADDPDLLVGVAWAVTAGSGDRAWADELVVALGGDPHQVADDARVVYHAALALASNAVGAAVVAARRLLLAARVEDPAAFLTPLAHASVDNAATAGAAALTGPIVRGDVGTVAAHLERLTADLPELLPAYRALAQATLEPVRPSLGPEVAAALDDLLAGGGPGVGPAAEG
ncbi:MAG: DUF2520 domain-containing protein [Nitriliruptor sp.]|nr:MAG: DUF2520 domain-containing protein [Nitriliruptor sp.]